MPRVPGAIKITIKIKIRRVKGPAQFRPMPRAGCAAPSVLCVELGQEPSPYGPGCVLSGRWFCLESIPASNHSLISGGNLTGKIKNRGKHPV